MTADEIRQIIPNLPSEIRDRVKKAHDNYTKTKDERFLTLILDILEQFRDDPKVADLVKRMR